MFQNYSLLFTIVLTASNKEKRLLQVGLLVSLKKALFGIPSSWSARLIAGNS